MQKIRNRKEDVIDESFEGLALAYEKYWVRHPEVRGLISRTRRRDKVSLVVGGGSGHERSTPALSERGLPTPRSAATSSRPRIRIPSIRPRRQ